ncbi:hypothetical protein CEV32_4050 [Brucella rhizosphaerae]|uniref:Uncharacterized protein n=1 Tax=Brucella rhizosphaerae TaxID=571254 RepID=A0A256FQY9_9HYPH|nr:hypothetical protein CEV32_4050 [Brucella rhizosphaerae]
MVRSADPSCRNCRFRDQSSIKGAAGCSGSTGLPEQMMLV